MDLTCRFAQEYLPTPQPDPVLETHLQNCEDCQEQTYVVEGPG